MSNDELKQHYREKLSPLVKLLQFNGVLLIARWSYVNSCLESPIPCVSSCCSLKQQELENFLNELPKAQTHGFSFTDMMVNLNHILIISFIMQNSNQVQITVSRGEGGESEERSNTVEREKVYNTLVEFIQNLTGYRIDNSTPTQKNGPKAYVDNLVKVISKYKLKSFYIFGIEGPTEYAKVIGGVAIGSVNELKEETLLIFREYIKGLMSPFHVKEMDQLRQRHALRSAIAAIMTRNMSHNIDSHITPRATVEAVRKRLRDLDFQKDLDTIQLLKDRLDKYRQERADFLAEITSEPLTTTKPILFYRGVILPLIENVLFMDNIARNEGICYQDKTNNRLRIRVFVGDTELKANYKCATSGGVGGTQPYSITYPDQGIPYTARCIDCKYKKSSTENHTAKPSELVSIPCQTTDIEIELPGPVGEHAIYGFLENFIRNAAKHNRQHFDDNPEENLEVNIRISEPEDEQEKKEFYVIEIWDNVTNPNKTVNAKVDGKKCETLYDLIKAYIESEVIDETGRKKEQAYGITEMKVNATLLRGSTDFMRMKEFLEVSKDIRKATQWSNGQYREVEEKLIYRFRLMKAKKMCGVFPNWSDEELQKNLQNQGIWIFKTVEELKQAVMPGEKSGENVPKSAASFRFAVFDCSGENGEEIAQKIPDLLPFLPFRVLVLKGNNNIKNLPKGVVEVNESGSAFPPNSNEIMVWLWTHWLQRWGSDLKILEIYLDQNSNDSPTNEWVRYAQSFNQYCENQGFPYRVRVWSRDMTNPCAGDVGWQGTHIVFDRHGAMRSRPNERNSIANRAYFDCELGKLSPDFVYIFQPQFPQSNEVWTIPFELLESGLLRILVIDERVAEKSREYVGGSKRWNSCFYAKVYLCTHLVINSETIALHKSVESDKPYLKLKFSKSDLSYETHESFRIDGVDMVIIHQGVLDNLKENADAFLQGLQKHIDFVIVDSGRGIPATLPPKIKFLPFSVLNDYLLGQAVAKYRLTQVCMSLTRKGGM